MSLLTQAMLNQVQNEYSSNVAYSNRGYDQARETTAGRWKMGGVGVKGGDLALKMRTELVNEKYNPMQKIMHTGSGLELEVPTSKMTETTGIYEQLKQKFWPTAKDYEKIDYTHLIGGDEPSFTELIPKSLKTKTNPLGATLPSAKAPETLLGKTGSLLGKVAPWAASAYSASKMFDKSLSTPSKVGHGLMALYTNPITSAQMIAGTKALGTAASTGYAAGGIKGAAAAVGSVAWKGIVLLGKTIMSFLPFSDRDLKENIVRVGRSKNGLNVYEWNYKGLPEERYQGVMVDEVPEEVRVSLGNTGFTGVDYSKIDVNFRRVG